MATSKVQQQHQSPFYTTVCLQVVDMRSSDLADLRTDLNYLRLVFFFLIEKSADKKRCFLQQNLLTPAECRGGFCVMLTCATSKKKIDHLNSLKKNPNICYKMRMRQQQKIKKNRAMKKVNSESERIKCLF